MEAVVTPDATSMVHTLLADRVLVMTEKEMVAFGVPGCVVLTAKLVLQRLRVEFRVESQVNIGSTRTISS